MEERELIERSLKGDIASFNSLVEAHQSLVYNTALRLLGDPSAAEDATQDAFISAFKALRSFRGGSFRAWLLRIASNSCIDQLRKRRHHAASLDSLLEADSPPQFADPAELPEDYALRQELARGLVGALHALPVDQRLVVILSDIQGLSYEEIAQATNASLGTVKSRLSRARAHLRDYLLKNRELLPDKFRQYK